MVIRTPDGKVTTIDSREESPAAMRPDSFFVDGEAPDPSDDADFDAARYSGLSAGVPGTVAGWDKALRRYGSWSLKRALRLGRPGGPARLRGRRDLRLADRAQRRVLR